MPKHIMNDHQENEHEFTPSDFYGALEQDLSTYPVNIDGKTVNCHHESSILMLNQIERFVASIVSSSTEGFKKKIRRLSDGSDKVTFSQTKLSSHFKVTNAYISAFRRYEHVYHFSEYVTLFQECCNELQLQLQFNIFTNREFYLPGVKKYEGDLYNDLIEAIRIKSKTKEFKKKVSNRKSNTTRQYKSAQKYIDGLFLNRSRLLVLRLDVGYLVHLNEYTDMPEQCVTYEQAKLDFKRFKNNWRHNQRFEHVIGHIWKLEYGEKKGYHYHLMFFLRGSEVEKDWFISDQIGKYWMETITKGRGTYHNCNANKKEYLHLGIGMINATAPGDAQLRVNVRNVAAYLTKNEQFLAMKLNEKDKVFGTGQILVKTTNRGRPRKMVLLA